MELKRNRAKGKINKENEISPIIFDIPMLDCFCKYVLTDSSYIRRQHLTNLQALLSIVDPSTYMNDSDKVLRYRFINHVLHLKLEKRMDNNIMILNDTERTLGVQISFIDITNPSSYQLSRTEIEWVTDTVTEILNYSFVFNYVDRIQDACARFKSTDFKYRGAIANEFETIADELKSSFRKNKVDSINNMVFSLQPEKFRQCIKDTYDIVTSPSRRLLCGMQGLNELTGGGFENQRVYMLFGMTAVGKSITLLNLAYQMKMANTNYKTKDPTKTPCIVYLTMENSVVETITRLFSIISNDKMNNYTLDEVIDILETNGKLVLNDESPIDIIITYKPNKSVDTNWLYTMCSDFEDQGYEVIALLQDHVKRIRSVFHNPDVRLELGDVVNEFKSFAIEKDIPVISVSHLNREAAKIIENIQQSKKNVDATKQLGKSTVGESFLMLDNLDWGANINIDFDEEGRRYMAFAVNKQRDDATRSYIAQPFVDGSRIRLAEDLHLPIPLFKENLHESSLYQGEDGRKNIRPSSYTNAGDIAMLDSMVEKKPSPVFEIPTKYNNMTPIGEERSEEELYEDYRVTPIITGAPSQPFPRHKKNPLIFYSLPPKPQIDFNQPFYFAG